MVYWYGRIFKRLDKSVLGRLVAGAFIGALLALKALHDDSSAAELGLGLFTIAALGALVGAGAVIPLEVLSMFRKRTPSGGLEAKPIDALLIIGYILALIVLMAAILYW